MQTRSSSKFVGEPSTNPTSTIQIQLMINLVDIVLASGVDIIIEGNFNLKKESRQLKFLLLIWKCLIFYDDDDDDEESSIPLKDIISELPLSNAITPDFSITDSLIMEDVHLDTISETESNKEYESSVEDLNLTPSESEDLSEDLSDIESECDVTFDSLLEEFSGELAHIDLISIEIDEADFDPEEEIRDILEELLNNDSLSLPENESFHFDRYYDPSSPRPIAKPLDDDAIYFDAKPDTGILTVKVVDDISEHYVFKPRILTAQPTLSPHLLSHRGFKAFQLIFDFSESPMMIYGGNIPILDRFSISILLDQLMYGGSSQAQDSVNKNKRFDCLDLEDPRARGFVLCSLELQSLA
ncbi:hypothetical protein Tco_0787000 [Tanacetum coccineum]